MAIIGVFDSGVGGLSVAKAIRKALPQERVIFKNDTKNVPYGNKSREELLRLVCPILNELVNERVDVIVIACNTVTTNIINELRGQMPVPVIGIEPMVKSAAATTKSGIFAVCATPMTLKSTRYQDLKRRYAHTMTILEPDCSDWSYMIETSQVNQQKICSITEDAISQGADVIVLGCTHYHWIEQIIRQCAAGRARVIQPEQAVVKQLERILASANSERPA